MNERPRRSWRSKLLELLVWALVAIATAWLMVALSERFLPANF